MNFIVGLGGVRGEIGASAWSKNDFQGDGMDTKRYLRWMVKWLTLKTYSSDLLCNDAAMWIFSVRLVMFFLISTECASWGYTAYHVGHAFAPFLAAFAVLAAFSVNWTLDGSVMTLDREPVTMPPASQKRGWIAENKAIALVLCRTVMISGVLYASSGFLVQGIYGKDIENKLANENQNRIEQKRGELLGPIEKRKSNLIDEVKTKEDQLTAEVQGLSPTGKIGCSSACFVLKEQLQALRTQLNATEQDDAEIREAFEHQDATTLSHRFHIDLLGDGLDSRGQIVEMFKKGDGFRRTEHLIQATLLILFVGLLLLKLYQPTAVAVYYSSQRQDTYQRYKRGSLNHLLRPNQLPDNAYGGMTTFEFVEWVNTVFLAGRVDEVFRQTQSILDADQTARQGMLKGIESSLEEDVQNLKEKLDTLSANGNAMEVEIKQATTDARVISEKLEDDEQERSRLFAALTAPGTPLEAYEHIFQRLTALNENIDRDSTRLNAYEVNSQTKKSRLASLRFEQGVISTDLAAKKTSLKNLRGDRDSLQQQYIGELKNLWFEQNRLLHKKLDEVKAEQDDEDKDEGTGSNDRAA
jgi:hypothetical protein